MNKRKKKNGEGRGRGEGGGRKKKIPGLFLRLFFSLFVKNTFDGVELFTYLWPTFRSSERLALLPVKIDENCFSIRFTSRFFSFLSRPTQICQRNVANCLPYILLTEEKEKEKKKKRRESKRWKATAPREVNRDIFITRFVYLIFTYHLFWTRLILFNDWIEKSRK